MPTAELIVSQPGRRTRRVETSQKLISIGRKDDNTVALPGDANVSRYHAVIKQQADGFWLIHLSESSSTLVNDQPVQTTRRLAHGDLICLGSSSTIEFLTPGAQEGAGDEGRGGNGASAPPPSPSNSPNANASTPATAPAATAPASGFPVGKVLGVAAGLLVVGLAAVLLISYLRPGSDEATNNNNARAARTSSANSDPSAREDSNARDSARDQRDTPPADTPPATTGGGGGSTAGVPPADVPPAGQANAEAVVQMADKLAVQLGQKSGYRFDPAFAALIKTYVAEYRASAGFSERARKHQAAINDEFINQGLPPLAGYVMAMSRTKFNEAGAGGVWGMPPQVVRASATGGAGAPDMSDPAAAAHAAAVHFKELFDVFGREHFMYAVACYGLTLDEAGRVVNELERKDPSQQLRYDFWRMKNMGVVKSEQVERVARFFAAGVVGENPQAFGLRDRPLSTLY
jgi:hypothetical protein